MSSPPKVLIVDDEERFRAILSKLLTVRGLEVITAGSGKEALEELRSQSYDVVLLDAKMPEMSGIEALSAIKKAHPEVEVIILTGHASVDVAVEITKLGGYDYLLKPCPIEELVEKIDSAYERKKTGATRNRSTEKKGENG